MTDMITQRPITGHLVAPNRGQIQIRLGKRVKKVGPQLYEVTTMHLVTLIPPAIGVKKVRFTLNDHIAQTDLLIVKVPK
jgi:hypothetical protein